MMRRGHFDSMILTTNMCMEDVICNGIAKSNHPSPHILIEQEISKPSFSTDRLQVIR